jgi:head-tail adaptor
MAPRSSGRRPHPLKLQKPVGEKVSDGDGGYTQDYETYQELFGSVEPATAARLERLFSAGAFASASHIVTVPFLTDMQLHYHVVYAGRMLDVLGYADPEERHIELVLVCQELKQ